MISKKDVFLSKREFEIMTNLWQAGKALIASEISAQSNLSINTTHATLRKLLKKEFIKVADIVYSGTVLSRSYEPTLTFEEYTEKQIALDFQKAQKYISIPKLVAAILDQEENEIETIRELETMLEARKNSAGKKP